MAVLFELGLQLAEVIYLAVENNRRRPIFPGYRLFATCQIDDREPPHPQRDAVLEQRAGIVRTAIPDDLAHVAQSVGPLV